jgi:hypothetical protein
VLRLVRIALVVAERLKLTPSPIRSSRADRVASPGARAEIRFRLRKPDRLTLALVDDRGRVVRTLVDPVQPAPGSNGLRGTAGTTRAPSPPAVRIGRGCT